MRISDWSSDVCSSDLIDASTPQLNSLLGVVGSLLGNGVRDSVLLADQPLYTVPAGGAVIAGVPMLHVNIAGLTGAEQATCTTNQIGRASGRERVCQDG